MVLQFVGLAWWLWMHLHGSWPPRWRMLPCGYVVVGPSKRRAFGEAVGFTVAGWLVGFVLVVRLG
jgi:hypothetical protein